MVRAMQTAMQTAFAAETVDIELFGRVRRVVPKTRRARLDPWVAAYLPACGSRPSTFNTNRSLRRCGALSHYLPSAALPGHIARAQPSLHTLGSVPSRTASSSSRPEHLDAGAARRCSEERP